MKRFALFTVLLLLLTATSALAAVSLEPPVADAFSGREWAGYTPLDFTYSHGDNGVCYVAMKKGSRNILCILEQRGDGYAITQTGEGVLLPGNTPVSLYNEGMLQISYDNITYKGISGISIYSSWYYKAPSTLDVIEARIPRAEGGYYRLESIATNAIRGIGISLCGDDGEAQGPYASEKLGWDLSADLGYFNMAEYLDLALEAIDRAVFSDSSVPYEPMPFTFEESLAKWHGSAHQWEGYTLALADGFLENGEGMAYLLFQKEGENTLCFLTWNGESWETLFTNSNALLPGDTLPIFSFETYVWLDIIYPEGAPGGGGLTLACERRNGQWYLERLEIDIPGKDGTYVDHLCLQCYEDRQHLFLGGRTLHQGRNPQDSLPVAGELYIESMPQINMGDLDLDAITDRALALYAGVCFSPVIPDSPGESPFPKGTLVDFTPRETYPVYSGPGKDTLRAAKGKALVSTNDWIQVFGREGDWILIQYGLDNGVLRMGYITAESLPKGVTAEPLAFSRQGGRVSAECTLTDDPLGRQGTLAVLKEGTAVTSLAALGDTWRYVEGADEKGKMFRGFMPERDFAVAPGGAD